MSNPPYRVFVTTCDRYLPALRPFAYLLNKYWQPSPQCVVIGFSPPDFPLPDNFSFHSVGRQQDYPFKRWSDALMQFLGQVDDRVFALMLEDYWITRGVHTHAVQVLYDYMHQFEYVAKIDLTGDRLYAHGADLTYGSVSCLDLVKSMPGSPYHLSLMTGLWRKEHLLRHMQAGESPHDLELQGTTRLSHDQDVIVLGTRQWPVRHTLALRGGNERVLNLAEVNPADVQALHELGYLSPWDNKP